MKGEGVFLTFYETITLGAKKISLKKSTGSSLKFYGDMGFISFQAG